LDYLTCSVFLFTWIFYNVFQVLGRLIADRQSSRFCARVSASHSILVVSLLHQSALLLLFLLLDRLYVPFSLFLFTLQ
jgi:hypothetical protein